MAIEAQYSKFRKQNCFIGIGLLLAFAAWFAYDGYINQKYIEKHTVVNELGIEVPDSDLAFNQKSPPFFVAGALLVAGFFFMVKNKKIVAGETSLIMPGQEIPYDNIEKINKTNFEKKGYFVLTYKNNDKEHDIKLSSKTYDNLEAVLDELIKKLSE